MNPEDGNEESPSEASRSSRRAFGVIALVTLILPGIGALVVLGSIHDAAPWLREAGVLGGLLFCLVTGLVTGLALVPTNIMSIASGWIFGATQGTPWVVLGITLGSLVGYAWTSRLGEPGLKEILAANPRLAAIHRAILGEDLRTVGTTLCLCRLSPLIPFASINLLFGASRVQLPLFVGGTVIGMLPRAAALVITGASLSELDFSQPADAWSLIAGIAATLAVVMVVTRAVKQALATITEPTSLSRDSLS